MNWYKFSSTIFLVVLVIASLAACSGEQPTPIQTNPPAQAEPTKEVITPIKLKYAQSSPHVWIQPEIAAHEGFFKDVGIDFEFVRFTSGKAALDALIGGQTDLASVAISPVIYAAFQDQPLRILAENATFKGEKITARADHGISKPEDLRGKKIGVTLGTDLHYFLNLFLEHNGMTEADVEVVNLPATDMVLALDKGDIDAFVSWRPQPDKAKELLGDKVIFLTQSEDTYFESRYVINTMQKLLDEKPEAFDRFMKAMAMAEEFAKANPEKVSEIVAKASEIDAETAKGLMEGYNFGLRLNEAFLAGAEGRAQWAMENDLAPEGASMPDFRMMLFPELLKEYLPNNVALE